MREEREVEKKRRREGSGRSWEGERSSQNTTEKGRTEDVKKKKERKWRYIFREAKDIEKNKIERKERQCETEFVKKTQKRMIFRNL